MNKKFSIAIFLSVVFGFGRVLGEPGEGVSGASAPGIRGLLAGTRGARRKKTVRFTDDVKAQQALADVQAAEALARIRASQVQQDKAAAEWGLDPNWTFVDPNPETMAAQALVEVQAKQAKRVRKAHSRIQDARNAAAKRATRDGERTMRAHARLLAARREAERLAAGEAIAAIPILQPPSRADIFADQDSERRYVEQDEQDDRAALAEQAERLKALQAKELKRIEQQRALILSEQEAREALAQEEAETNIFFIKEAARLKALQAEQKQRQDKIYVPEALQRRQIIEQAGREKPIDPDTKQLPDDLDEIVRRLSGETVHGGTEAIRQGWRNAHTQPHQ